MTTFGWDTSNYDDPITIRDGIDFFTHKAGEGHHMYYDREYRQSMENALSFDIPVLGAYFVNHPGSVADQVDWFIQILDQDTPWWRTHPCFILQIDAEKFDYMDRAPNLGEIQAFGDRLVNTHGIDARRVLAYAPRWLYGDALAGLTYRLWASDYGGNPYVHYRDAYPGDQDVKRWRSYSGQEPLILQYGSNATIGNQTTCDANAFRGTVAELMSMLGSGQSAPMPEEGDDVGLKGIIAQDKSSIVRAWIDPILGPVYDNIIDAKYISMWTAMGFELNPTPADDGNHYPFTVDTIVHLGIDFYVAQAAYYKALRAGGASGPLAVNLSGTATPE